MFTIASLCIIEILLSISFFILSSDGKIYAANGAHPHRVSLSLQLSRNESLDSFEAIPAIEQDMT